MKRCMLKKINKAAKAEEVEYNLAGAGFTPFEEGDIADLTLMTVLKGRQHRCGAMRHEGDIYTLLQSYTEAEGAEQLEFIALSAFKKTKEKKGDGRKKVFLYFKMYVR